jgi:hypothetical protein
MATNNDGLMRYHIEQRTKELEEMGIEVPTFDEETPLKDQLDELKELVKQQKAKQPKKPEVSPLAKLQQEADKLGAYYEPDWTEEQLKVSIRETKEALAAKQAQEKAVKEAAKAAPAASEGTLNMEQFAKVLGAELSKGLAGMNKEASRLVTEAEFDPADKVEGKTYFVPMIWWKLPAKRIGGQLIKAPYGGKGIIFKLLHGSAVRTGDQWNTRYLSAYYTESRKEQEYMETHPLYNKVFFLSDIEARVSSDQVKFAQKFSRHMENLANHQAPALYNMAPGLGVKVDTSMSLVVIRTNIAEALAAKEMQADREHMRNLIEQGQREALLASTAT